MSKKFKKKVPIDNQSMDQYDVVKIVLNEILPRPVGEKYDELFNCVSDYIHYSFILSVSGRNQDKNATLSHQLNDRLSKLKEEIQEKDSTINELRAQLLEIAQHAQASEDYEKIKKLSQEAQKVINERNNRRNILSKYMEENNEVSADISKEHLSMSDARKKLSETVSDMQRIMSEINQLPNGGVNRINGIEVLPKHFESIDRFTCIDAHQKAEIKKNLSAGVPFFVTLMKYAYSMASKMVKAHSERKIFSIDDDREEIAWTFLYYKDLAISDLAVADRRISDNYTSLNKILKCEDVTLDEIDSLKSCDNLRIIQYNIGSQLHQIKDEVIEKNDSRGQ